MKTFICWHKGKKDFRVDAPLLRRGDKLDLVSTIDGRRETTPVPSVVVKRRLLVLDTRGMSEPMQIAYVK